MRYTPTTAPAPPQRSQEYHWSDLTNRKRPRQTGPPLLFLRTETIDFSKTYKHNYFSFPFFQPYERAIQYKFFSHYRANKMSMLIKQEKFNLANSVIKSFCIDQSLYEKRSYPSRICHGLHGGSLGSGDGATNDDGCIFFRRQSPSETLNLKVSFNGALGCIVYIGKDVEGSASIKFASHAHNSICWIGDYARLNRLTMSCWQANDFIAIGNNVTTGPNCTFISGKESGRPCPAIITGDDCMLSQEIIIRNSDSHPIISLETGLQVNESNDIVIVEPHVWIGQRTSILKNVSVGACSVIALGSVVTKSVPRFAVAAGVPAKIKSINPDTVWARSMNPKSIEEAKQYAEQYPAL